MQPDGLDEPPDLRLRRMEHHAVPALAQAPGDHDEVDHERRVGEVQVAQVDVEVALDGQRARERAAPTPLRGGVLVPGAAQGRGLGREANDRGNLPKRRGYTQPMPSVEEVEDALSNVIDPELGLDFVELGLIYGIEVDGAEVRVTFTLTSPGCPIGPQVAEQIDEFVSELDGVTSVESTMTFDPPWTPDRMSEDAKFALGF